MPPRPRSLLLFFTIIAAGETRPFVIFVTENDFKDTEPDPEGPEPYIYDTPDESTSSSDESSNWDDLGLSNVEIDSGSWSSVMGSEVNFKTENSTTENGGSRELRYARGVRGMIDAVSAGDYVLVEESVNETESVAKDGHAHAQSTMGILYGLGIARPRGQSKAFLYHQFAKDGNLQSKMALAYTYFRQEMYEKAVELYAELAEVAVTSSLMSKEPPVIEVVRIHNGGEENKEGLRMFRGEGSDDFQVTNYLAERGDAGAMYKIGMLYYYGLHGVVQNDEKALHWFSKAVEKGEVRSMELLGEIYARGSVVERNYTMAMQWLSLASHHGLFSANNGMGYLYAKGYGVKNKNHTKATILYKIVAERGPWSSLSRWALDYFLKGDVGKALLLYLRMAELGYEVAQSNAAWILDKYAEHYICMGESGICTDTERHLRTHSLWWKASEQGNEHAALLIGDAYYYGWLTERDYERVAEAYIRAQSQSNAQAMFNLGYMHEHGQGLPYDLHLAKRYYDQALENNPHAKLPVTLALTSLWIRKNYVDSFLVEFIDALPYLFTRVESWVDSVVIDEGNATILTLFVCLLTVLYLRKRKLRHAAITQQPNGGELYQL